MTGERELTHNQILDEVIKVLREKGFSLYELEKPAWEPMRNVTIVPNDEALFQKVISKRWYLGEFPDKQKINIDAVGCLYNERDFLHDFSIAVEVSYSSDIRKEILKLKTVLSKWKVVVTKDIEGELEGIPVVHYLRFGKLLDSLLKGISAK